MSSAAALSIWLVRKLLQVAEYGGQVEHPNLCKLYNVFETPDELVLSLELLRGRPLLEAVSAVYDSQCSV